MAASRGTPQEGDRAAFDTVNHPTVHALDVKNGVYLIHLPLPSADGNYARDSGSEWVSQAGLLLADFADYARGSIIRGGAANWETYDASGAGKVLIGDGTDVESRVLAATDLPTIPTLDTAIVNDAGDVVTNGGEIVWLF